MVDAMKASAQSGVQKLLAAESGSATAVARRLSKHRACSRQLVEYWVTRDYVPGSWAPVVAREFDIPLSELNPRVYPGSMISVERASA